MIFAISIDEQYLKQLKEEFKSSIIYCDKRVFDHGLYLKEGFEFIKEYYTRGCDFSLSNSDDDFLCDVPFTEFNYYVGARVCTTTENWYEVCQQERERLSEPLAKMLVWFKDKVRQGGP